MGGPGGAHFAAETALVLKNPTYIREIQLYLSMAGSEAGFFCLSTEITSEQKILCGPHFVDILRGALLFAEHVDAVLDLPPSTAMLPFETIGAPAWADPMARVIAAHVDGHTFHAVLQYRHDDPGPVLKPGGTVYPKPNNICRVHLVERNGTVDRLATVACGQPGEGLLGVQSLVYGPFAVGMNSNLYRSGIWRVPDEYRGLAGVELISGQPVPVLPSSMHLQPNQTVVVYVSEKQLQALHS